MHRVWRETHGKRTRDPRSVVIRAVVIRAVVTRGVVTRAVVTRLRCGIGARCRWRFALPTCAITGSHRLAWLGLSLGWQKLYVPVFVVGNAPDLPGITLPLISHTQGQPMTIQLQPVLPSLVEKSARAQTHVTNRLAADFVGLSVGPLGSSTWAGSLSKGDVDLLVRVPSSSASLLRDRLMSIASVAQPENWDDAFASFVFEDPTLGSIGLQVVTVGARIDGELQDQQQALADPLFRIRYDVAKQHAAEFGANTYWQVKELFWRTRTLPGPLWRMAREPVLKVLRPEEWEQLLHAHQTNGAPIDEADGFVHFSTPTQVHETISKHFDGAKKLWLLTLDAATLGEGLRWERSRNHALFPHLYGPLRLQDVCLARPVVFGET